MKKAISILLVLIMSLSLCACGSPSATVTIDGVEQTVKTSDMRSYESKYIGNEITVTGKITSIDGPYYVNDSVPYYYVYYVNVENEFEIRVHSENPIMQNLDVGDNVTATGYIKDAFGDIVICGRNSTLGFHPSLTEISKN